MCCKMELIGRQKAYRDECRENGREATDPKARRFWQRQQHEASRDQAILTTQPHRKPRAVVAVGVVVPMRRVEA